jgi:hypothetical protein
VVVLTEAIFVATRNELRREGVEPPATNPGDPDPLVAQLDAEIRAALREYLPLVAKHRGRKRVGSRVWPMLAQHGVVEMLRRLFRGPTEGLDECFRVGRPDLAFERIALQPKYARIAILLAGENVGNQLAETVKEEQKGLVSYLEWAAMKQPAA